MNNLPLLIKPIETTFPKSALRRNLRLVLCLRAAQRFMLIAPILVPFFAFYGQDLREIFLLESVYAVVILAMELPSGYLADRFGRVAVLRLGGVFWSAGWILLLLVEDFAGLVVFEVLMGLGSSLLSGADLALLYDSEKALHKEQPQRTNRAVRNLFVIGMAAEGLASLSATALLLFDGIALVIAVQTGCGLLVLAASLLLREPPGRQASLTSVAAEWASMRSVLLSLWQQSVFMRRLLGALCLWPLVNMLAIWLMQRVWVELELTLLHFGWIWCLLQLIGGATGQLAHGAERWFGAKPVILLIAVLVLAGLCLMGGGRLSWAIAGSALLFAARGFFSVLFMDALNRRIEDDYRATINSLIGFGFRSAFVLTAPILGFVFDGFGLWVTVYALMSMAGVIAWVLLFPLARVINA
jgi:MFS family permease